MSSSTPGTPVPATPEVVDGEQRLALLRAMTESIHGRGRMLGPAGTWVRVDFDVLRSHLQAS